MTKPKPGPDELLICSCVEYASQIARGRGAYAADPTGDTYARSTDDNPQDCARRALATILKCPPESVTGLHAKVSLVPIVLGDHGDAGLEEQHIALFNSIADDMKRLVALEVRS